MTFIKRSSGSNESVKVTKVSESEKDYQKFADKSEQKVDESVNKKDNNGDSESCCDGTCNR